MAIEKPLAPIDIGPRPVEPTDEQKVEVEVVNPEAVSIETEDGGMIIDFGKEEDNETSEFDSNLAEFIEDSELDKLANDLSIVTWKNKKINDGSRNITVIIEINKNNWLPILFASRRFNL